MRRTTLFVAAALLIASVETRAEGPAPSADELSSRARRAREVGNLDEAIEGYARAYQVSGSIGLLFDLAEVHREAGHDADALRIYYTYLRRAPSGDHREVAEKRVKELERRSANKDKRAAEPAPSKPIGEKSTVAPFPPPATAATKETAKETAKEPQKEPARASLRAPARESLEASSNDSPEAAAKVGTRDATRETAKTAPTIDLTRRAPPPVPAERPLPLPRWLPWSLGAATVVLGAAAVVSGVSASHRFDTLVGSCGQTADGCAGGDIDDLKSRARRTNLLWALTGVAGAGAAITATVNVRAAGLSGLWRF